MPPTEFVIVSVALGPPSYPVVIVSAEKLVVEETVVVEENVVVGDKMEVEKELSNERQFLKRAVNSHFHSKVWRTHLLEIGAGVMIAMVPGAVPDGRTKVVVIAAVMLPVPLY